MDYKFMVSKNVKDKSLEYELPSFFFEEKYFNTYMEALGYFDLLVKNLPATEVALISLVKTDEGDVEGVATLTRYCPGEE
jgi:hypothetical protein